MLRSVQWQFCTDLLGQTFDSIFKSSLMQKEKNMGPISCPETSVRKYHSMLRKVPREGRSHLPNGRSLKSCMVPLCGETTLGHV
jgi:hypothetical protein